MCKSEIFAKIIGFVSKETEIPAHEIIGTSRKEEVVDARCILIRLLIESGMYAGWGEKNSDISRKST